MDCVPDARARHVVGAGARAVVNGPARAARNVRGTSRGGPPDAGWGGQVGRCQLQGVSGSESPKRALMVACLNQGLRRKWVCCRLLAGCKSVSQTRRLVIRTGGLPALPHALAPVSTCETLWPVCRRKRPAASDGGMPSSCRRFRPRSSRRPVFSDAGERETAPPGASSEPLPDKHAGRSRNNAAAGALFYSV